MSYEFHISTRGRDLANKDQRLDCPFCGSQDCHFDQVAGVGSHVCNFCGARGPLVIGRKKCVTESRSMWNTRPQEELLAKPEV